MKDLGFNNGRLWWLPGRSYYPRTPQTTRGHPKTHQDTPERFFLYASKLFIPFYNFILVLRTCFWSTSIEFNYFAQDFVSVRFYVSMDVIVYLRFCFSMNILVYLSSTLISMRICVITQLNYQNMQFITIT